MEVLVIDGQGGRIGQQLIRCIRERFPETAVIAVGTNSMATAAMLKGGAQQAATGENAMAVACRRADVILGPLGIVVADALLGEISPAMAVAVGQARAKKILIPLNRCDSIVAGVEERSVSALLESALGELEKALRKSQHIFAKKIKKFQTQAAKAVEKTASADRKPRISRG